LADRGTPSASARCRPVPHLLELARAGQLLLQRDEVDGVAALAERHHLVEDARCASRKKSRASMISAPVERLVVDQDRAEHRALGVEVVRQRAFGSSDVGHLGGGGTFRARWCSHSKRKSDDREGRDPDRPIEAARPSARPAGVTRCRRSSVLLADDADLDLRRHVAVDLQRHGDVAERLDGLGEPIFRLSILESLGLSASAMSADVTDPYSVWFSPTRRAISTTSACSSARRAPRPAASPRRRAPRPASLALDLPAVRFSVTASASLRGSR
jgi:hypothetical protein